MAYDPYDLCPCGSGKKLKFCCQNIADDMERVTRLIQDNQFRAALKQLEAIDKRQPNSEWVTTTRALVHIETGEGAAARDILKPWLAAHPDSDFATVLYALAQLQAEGYDAAKKSIQRAFQKGAKKFPSLVSGLAGTMSITMAERRQALAVRECLSLALRFAAEADRQDVFVRLVEFDNDSEFFYPLRSLHPLPHVEVPAELEKDFKRAAKLAQVGCWDTAAETFSKLAEKLPDQPLLIKAAGLCWAWDGDSPRAASELHRAAEKISDFPVAVEAEVLAQLLEMIDTKDLCTLVSQDGTIASVSRLLSTFDEQPQLVRLPLPPEANAPGANAPAAMYQVLDRAKSESSENLCLDTVAHVFANLVIMDAAEGQPARLAVTGMAGEQFARAWEAVKAAAGDQVTWSSETPEVIDEFPREMLIFAWQWSLPPKTPLGKRHELERQQWRKILDDLWPNQPLPALRGQTPLQAAQNPELRTRLTAAVYVLDAVSEQRRHSLDLPAMLQRLGLEPLPTLTLSPESSPSSLPLLQLHRLNPTELTDAQLLSVVNRALLIHHDSFLKPVLETVIQRPQCMEQLDQNRIYQTLIDLYFRHGDRATALKFVQEAKEKLASTKTTFEHQWTWDLRELMLRLTDPGDPELKPMLQKFASYYSPKIPQLRGYLEAILLEAGVESPWSASSIITADSGAVSSGGVWTPERETAAAGSGKLWLPGQ